MNSLHRGSCYKIFTCGGEFSLLHLRVLSCNQFLFSLQFIYEYDQSLAPIHLNSARFCSRRHSNYYSTASSHHLTPEKSFPGKQVSFFYLLRVNYKLVILGASVTRGFEHRWQTIQVQNLFALQTIQPTNRKQPNEKRKHITALVITVLSRVASHLKMLL